MFHIEKTCFVRLSYENSSYKFIKLNFYGFVIIDYMTVIIYSVNLIY